MVAAVASRTSFENVVAGLGKAFGIGALLVAAVYVVVGTGLWDSGHVQRCSAGEGHADVKTDGSRIRGR